MLGQAVLRWGTAWRDLFVFCEEVLRLCDPWKGVSALAVVLLGCSLEGYVFVWSDSACCFLES